MTTSTAPPADASEAGKAAAAAATAGSLQALHAHLVRTFKSGRTKSYEWRIAQILGLKNMLLENTAAAAEAMRVDLGRPRNEAIAAEIYVIVGELDHILKNLKKWMVPEKRSTPLLQQPGRSVVIREPKGVVLNITPWNFTVKLSVKTMAGIISAGNCCLLKPSEVAPACEQFLKEYLPRYVDTDAVTLVTGGVAETKELLKLRWDHIVYTGHEKVGREVLAAAAPHMTPCTLELGGKSPTVVLPGANLPVAAKRICAGKFMNAGQICTSPDYALVHKDVADALEAELAKTLREWYGEDAQQSHSFGRIVNERHFDRLKALVDSAEGAQVSQAGQMDKADKFVPPTLVKNPPNDCALMNDEVFGPVLPWIVCESLDEMVERINGKEKPLAMYIFGKEADANKIISQTSSGGVCVNDTLLHSASSEMPFGGVGHSGMGRYQGKWGFDEFSHLRAVMYRATWTDSDVRYPPYTEGKLKLLSVLMVKGILPKGTVPRLLLGAGAMAAVGLALGASPLVPAVVLKLRALQGLLCAL